MIEKRFNLGMKGSLIKSLLQRLLPGGEIDAALADKANVNQLNNPNLLINWYLKDPINQRGQNVYTAAGYTIDMLYNRTTNTKLSLTDKGLKIEVTTAPGGSKNQFVSQRLENYKELLGKTVTLSWLVTEAQCSGSGLRCYLTASNGVGLNSQSVGGDVVYVKAPGLYSITATLPPSIDYSGINAAFLMHDNSAIGDYVTVEAWKLELGSVSTLAHREGDAWVLNDPPPDPAVELAKCQRYQINLATKASYQIFGIGRAASATSATISAPLPVTMRIATPALEVDAAKFLLNNTIPVLGMTLSNASANAAKINVTVAGGLTAGEACFLTNANNIVPLILNATL